MTDQATFDMATVKPDVRAAFGMVELLRRVDFPAENVYCEIYHTAVYIVLKTQGLEYRTIIVGAEVATFGPRWEAFTTALATNAITDADLERAWMESEARESAADILSGLITKGFRLPCPNRSMN